MKRADLLAYAETTIGRWSAHHTNGLDAPMFVDEAIRVIGQLADALRASPIAVRRRMPSKRRLEQHKLKIGGHSIHVGIGFYDDGAPGEVWLDASKDGSDLRHFVNGFAIALSLLLQYGVPVSVIAHAFGKLSGGPHGEVRGHNTIKSARSIIDLVAQLLQIEGEKNAHSNQHR